MTVTNGCSLQNLFLFALYLGPLTVFMGLGLTDNVTSIKCFAYTFMVSHQRY